MIEILKVLQLIVLFRWKFDNFIILFMGFLYILSSLTLSFVLYKLILLILLLKLTFRFFRFNQFFFLFLIHFVNFRLQIYYFFIKVIFFRIKRWTILQKNFTIFSKALQNMFCCWNFDPKWACSRNYLLFL